ncbi:MAG: hypothetical protein ACOYW3_05495 [Bacteroidota bacterium]
MQKLLAISLLSATFLVAGCTESLDPTPYTYTKVFTGEVSKTWSLTLIEVTENNKVVDRFKVDCALDDSYTFYATSDRLYKVDQGSAKCSEEETSSLTDVWAFNNATATLTIILPILSSSRLPFIVKKADDDDLLLEIFFDEEGTGSYRIHFEAKSEE